MCRAQTADFGSDGFFELLVLNDEGDFPECRLGVQQRSFEFHDVMLVYPATPNAGEKQSEAHRGKEEADLKVGKFFG